MAPSAASLAQVVVGLAVELGCSRILLIHYSPDKEFDKDVLRTMERTARLHSLVVGAHTDHEELIQEALRTHTKYETTIIVLDCKLEDAAILIQTTRLLGQFIWLFLERNYNEAISFSQEYRLSNALAVRRHHACEDWLSDTSTLVNITLQQIQMQSKGRTTPSDKIEFVRAMVRKEFQGKTGLVKFPDFQRTGTKFEIMRLESKDLKQGKETSQWTQVGSSVGAQVTLQNTFWKGSSPTDTPQIKVVTIEHNPMLLMSTESLQEDQECIVDYPCIRYVPQHGNNSSKNPVKFCCTGLLIDMVHMLVKDLGLIFDLYLVQDGKYGSLDPATGQWNGMIRDLIDHKADMALAAVTINAVRETVIDLSEPFFMGELKIVVSSTQVENTVRSFGFLSPFDGYLWIMLLLTITVVVTITWFLEKFSPYGYNRSGGPQRHRFGIPVSMSYVWSEVLKLTLDDITPKSFSARLTSAVFSFATFIITASYTANLAASLVQYEIRLPVTGIRDSKNPPEGFKFGALSSSSHEMFFSDNEDPVYRKIGRNMKRHGVKSMTEGLKKIRQGDMDAFFSTSPFMELEASKIAGCPFVMLQNPITTFANGLAFPKGSQWKRPISQLILKYQRKDFFRKAVAKWFDSGCSMGTRRVKMSSRLNFQNFIGLFLTCVAAIGVCLLLLVMETSLYRCRRYVSKTSRTLGDMECSHDNHITASD